MEKEREAEGWVIKVHLIRSLHQLIMYNCSQLLNMDLKCSVLNVDWLPEIKGLFDVRVWIGLLFSSLLGSLETRDEKVKSQNLVQNEFAISAKKADLSGYTYFYWPLNCNLYFIVWICSCHKNVKTLCYCSLVILVVKNIYVGLNVNVWRIIRKLIWLIFHWENYAERRFVCLCFNLGPRTQIVINPSNVAVEIKIYW